jgi:hypothetical protein
MLLNVGSGGGAAAAPAAGGAGGAGSGGAEAAEEAKEEEKEEGKGWHTHLSPKFDHHTDTLHRERRIRRGHGLWPFRLSCTRLTVFFVFLHHGSAGVLSLYGTDSPHRGSEFYHKRCDKLGHSRGNAKVVDSKVADVPSESKPCLCPVENSLFLVTKVMCGLIHRQIWAMKE